MTANTHRGEFTASISGVDYVIRPTIELMEKFENTFGGLVGCMAEKKCHELYAMAGMLIEHAVDPVPEGKGKALAFEHGLKGIDVIIETYVRATLRVPLPVEDKPIGMGVLGLQPEVFWRMTLYELMTMAMKGKAQAQAEAISNAADFRSMFNSKKAKR